MKIDWVGPGDDAYSKDRLAKYYANHMIPAEKKPYLTRLDRSAGPFLAVATGEGKESGIMDAASQIATLGLGFNPAAFFGVPEQLESWLNIKDTENYDEIRKAFKHLIQRKLGWNETHLYFCQSGAEANESALGAAFRGRVRPNARKVLAFEGSFHGRMLVALSATWGPAKRAPFEWPGYEAQYTDYPELDSDQIDQPIPKGWHALWADAPSKNFEVMLERHAGVAQALAKDPMLAREIAALNKVRGHLVSGKIFAVLIEPMQCEGGDRYSSGRFHNALLNMARSFRVPLIYDEVQTGFRLGRKFFWHQMFDLRGPDGAKMWPDYITCAKKSQAGLVISHQLMDAVEQFSVSSMIRGWAHGFILDQFRDEILKIEKLVRKELQALIKRHSIVCKPRACGLAFSFEFKEDKQLNQFVADRFTQGLMYYPAGSHCARFRMGLAFGPEEIKAMFQKMSLLISKIEGKEPAAAKKNKPHELDCEDPALKYAFHEIMLDWKLRLMKDPEVQISRKELQAALDQLGKQYLTEKASKLELVIIDKKNFKKFRQTITRLEKRNYEPSRQTDIEKFAEGMKDRYCIALGLMHKDQLVGLAFGAALKYFPYERGVRADKFIHDPDAIYMLDTTVDKDFQGCGLGKLLKYAVALTAMQVGVTRIQGRNRARVAKQMLNINLSMGAYEQRYLREDYPDEERYRDVVYYTCPLRWQRPRFNLSNGVDCPVTADDLDAKFLKNNLPAMVNKLTLSNFVSESFLEGVYDFSKLLPEEMRHMYTASGLSECADKAIKTLWFTRKPKQKMISFKGCFFGHGSFLSRSLSGHGEPFFPVEHLPFPTIANWEDVLKQLRDRLQKDQYLAVWAEPLQQLTMHRMPRKFLVALKKLCNETDTALIYNETASQLHRFQIESYFASNDPELQPDVAYAYLGNQCGVVFTKERYFIKDPLMMISTWDGDEYSMQAYMQGVRRFVADAEDYKKKIRRFESRLRAMFDEVTGVEYFVENGTGWFTGDVPYSISCHFERSRDGKGYLICASPSAINQFLEEFDAPAESPAKPIKTTRLREAVGGLS